MSNNDFYVNLLGLKLEDFNPNPKYGTDEGGVNDCFIRAMCKLLNKSWDAVFYDVAQIAFEEKAMYNSVALNKKYLERFGYKFLEFKYHAATIGQFMYENKNGSFLIGNSSHIVAYIDGIIYDKQYCLKNIDRYLISYANYVFTNHKLNNKYFNKLYCENIIINRGDIYHSIENSEIYYLITSISHKNVRIAAILQEVNPLFYIFDSKTICVNDIWLHYNNMLAEISINYIKDYCLYIGKVDENIISKLKL